MSESKTHRIRGLGARPWRGVLALVLTGFLAGTFASPAHGSGEVKDGATINTVGLILDNQYGATFRNNDGDWTFWKNCFEYWDGSRTVAIGPGYIGRLTRKVDPTNPNDNRVYYIVNDEREKNPPNEGMPSINHPAFGGLGQFGWHHARGTEGQLNTSDGNRVWNITGRTCAATNDRLGVVSAQVIQGPLVSGNIGYFDMDVFFGDQSHSAANPILRVRYRWRIFDSVIKMWAQVSSYCSSGCPDGLGYAFIKEPKFVANVARTPGQYFPPYTRTVVFDRSSALCAQFLGSNPHGATGHSGCGDRVRFRFDFGTSTSGTNGNCTTTSQPCLNVVATAYDIDDGAFSQSRQHYLWEGWGWGLDQLAVRSGGRGQGNSTGCNTTAGYVTSPAQDGARRWELIGGAKPDGVHYDNAAGMFPGWEGCSGAYDAGALYRLMDNNFNGATEYWGVHMQFSINDGWSIPSMP